MNINNIESEFQVLGSRIVSLKLSNDFVCLNLSEDGLKREFDVSYEILDVTDEENTLNGIIQLNVSVLISSENSNEYKLALSLEGCFLDSKIKDEEQFKKVLSINGCTCLYSIARAIITSISSQSCLGNCIVLPMINTFKLVSEEKVQDK